MATIEQKKQFEELGYIFQRQLFSSAEMAGLTRAAKNDRQLASEAYGKRDATGAETKLAVRNELEESPYSAVVRSARVARTMESILHDEIYHYHHKMMLKEPLVGGAWEWHQDYGYWYQNGCLYPDMASCLIAVDTANRNNGCLQILERSHMIGRIDHVKIGDQVQADPDRVAAATKQLNLVYCEMQPGDALFFHGNLLHRSDANTSEHPRWSLICCYNTKHNDPIFQNGRHPNYHPLEIWDDQYVSDILTGM